MKPVEAILRDARQRIIDNGWCQFVFTLRSGQVCALGALQHVPITQSDVAHRTARTLLREVIGRYDIGYWNDDPVRTKDHVIAAFGLAIARAKREGK